MANPEIAKAKAVQELLMLQGLSEKDATKQAVRIYGGQKQVRI